MLRRLIAAGTAAVAGLVAACEEAPRSTVTYARGDMEPFLADIAARGPLLVETMDTGFTEDHGTISTMVAMTIARGIHGRVIQATPDATQAGRTDFRVRVMFDAPQNANANRLCRGQMPAPVADPHRLHVLAAFCREDELFVSVIGSLPRPQTLTHDSVGRLLTQMGRQMFDRRDP